MRAREIWAKQGLCRHCGSPDVVAGAGRCKEHRDRKALLDKRRLDERSKIGLCTHCLDGNATNNKKCDSCLEKGREKGRAYARKLREGAHNQYGGKCVCCGLSNTAGLQFDHINGGGAQHRRTEKGAQILARWAYFHYRPDILQLLCGTCHSIKTLKGACSVDEHY